MPSDLVWQRQFINWISFFADLISRVKSNIKRSTKQDQHNATYAPAHLHQDILGMYFNPKMSFETNLWNFFFGDLSVNMLADEYSPLRWLLEPNGKCLSNTLLFSSKPLWWCPWQKHLTPPAPAELSCAVAVLSNTLDPLCVIEWGRNGWCKKKSVCSGLWLNKGLEGKKKKN